MPPADPAPAATLILARNPSDPRIYWVRRAPSTSFLPGYHAFPGGRVDPDDPGLDQDAQARFAALRETHEEVGLALLDPPPPPGDPRPFAALCAAGHRPRLEALTYVRDNLSPAYLGRRFRTRYYLTWVDAAADPRVDPAGGELDLGEWIRPAAALARFAAGEILLAPPTLAVLRALAAGDVHTWAAHAGEPHVSPVRPGLDLLPLRTPTLPPATHTNCSLVGERQLILVDPASPYPDQQAILDTVLAARAARGARVAAVVLTHHHSDHIADARRLADAHQAPLLAHPLTAQRVPFPVDAPLTEGDPLALEPAHTLDVLHTPGHAPGHLVLVHRATRTAIVGDMVAGVGTILIDPEDGDMAAYLASLERLRALNLSALIPAHGNVIGGPEACLTRFIAHRLAREAQVCAALAAGPGTLAELVALAYADAPPALRAGRHGGLAGRSLQAHLHKLLAEGRARALPDGRYAAA